MLITFLFAALVARLIYIEVVSTERLQALALDQWMREVPLSGERGHIYDRNGVLLADSRTVYTVYVRPNAVKDKEHTTAAICSVLGLDAETVSGKVYSKKSEMTIAKGVSKDEMTALVATGATGIYYSQKIERVYPYGDFLTQILGFTNADCEGQTGLELKYDKYLQGIDGYILTETDLVGRELDTNVTRYIAGSAGGDAHLTLDYYIQSFAESAVADAYLKYSAKSASCIIMDVNTGEMLAVAQKPSFDLNNVPRDNIAELFSYSKAMAVSNVYEPGSTFKILTAAAGLELNVINRDYRFYCPGYEIVDGQRIKCWKTTGHGSQNFDEGVQNSCNVLFMNIAMKLGAERFYGMLEKFGIMQKTGIDITGEASALTIPLDSVKTVDIARMGFGQAIAVTSAELLRAAASVVNGGWLVTPYVMGTVTAWDGTTLFTGGGVTKTRVISEKTSSDMREILEKVVMLGSGKNAQVKGYRIGGKTGTAQKYENGIIAHGKYVSTFLGFAPADKPQYIILMTVDEPQGGVYYGSIVAAPYVGQIFSKIFAYKGIQPSQYEAKPQFEMPDVTNMSVSDAVLILKSRNIYYEMSGEGATVGWQIPAAGSLVTTDTVALIDLK